MYATEENVEALLDRDLTANESSLFSSINKSMGTLIDNYTGRSWDDDPDESTNYYDGNNKKELFIDDYTEITKIEVLDSFGSVFRTHDDSDDWIEYPLNSTPKNSIRLRHYTFPNGSSNIKITGTFVSGDVPDDVEFVCDRLVAEFYNQNKVNKGFKRESIEGYSREIWDSARQDEQLKSILASLDGYKKISL